MAEQVLTFKGIGSIHELKREILVRLKIHHARTDLFDFNERIDRYLSTRPGHVVRLVIDLESIRARINSKVTSELHTVKYPEGFEFGQPHMMWGFEPDSRSPAERDADNAKIGEKTNDEFDHFQNELKRMPSSDRFIIEYA